MGFQTIEYERQGSIGILSLNRPEKLNAITLEMIGELREVLAGLASDLSTRVVILRANGRMFCAGTDLNVLTHNEGDGNLGEVQFIYHKTQQPLSEIPLLMRRAPQPIIAAVHGAAAGGGFAMALASDMRIAAESARFNAAFIRAGLSGGDVGVSYFLPRMVGLSKAAEYLYTGRFMDAHTAEELGVVSQVVPDDQLDAAAFELAEEVLRNSPLGIRMTKEVLNANIDAGCLENALHMENRTQALCTFTDDCKEAAKAFLEKRDPRFQDR